MKISAIEGTNSRLDKLLLGFASTVILGFGARGTYNHIFCLKTLGSETLTQATYNRMVR
jgi:hypothetical protein